MQDLLTALALVLVLEGALWSLLPGTMRQAAIAAIEAPPATVRAAGLAAAALGVALVWLIRG
jgi:hypothetical protein